MFRGEFEHSIDAKGRTSLPARFREILAAGPDTQLVLTRGLDGNLWLFPPGPWKALEEKLGRMSQFRPEVRKLLDQTVARSHDCTLDSMGRVLVPPSLRQYAGLQSNVIWTGLIDRIGLWDKERWNARSGEILPEIQTAEFAKIIGELGL